jgi:glycosyltransferase involved in cell wall biosynthesis
LKIFPLIYQPITIIYLFISINNYLVKNKVKIDLLFAHSQLVNFYILYFLKIHNGLKVNILWEFNVVWGFGEKNTKIKSSIRRFFQILSQYILILLADGCVFQTNSTKIWLENRYNYKFKKYVILVNSYETDLNVNKKFKTNDSLRILVFGLLDDLNGINFLIKALPKLSLIQNLKIDIYGQGNLLDRLLQVEKLYKIIEYKGTFDKNELVDILNNYNFGLIPRIDCLGAKLYIPTKLVEIMGNGIIPICSNVNGLTEVVNHGVNGFLFEKEDVDSLYNVLNELPDYETTELNKISRFAVNTIFDDFSMQTFQKNEINFFKEMGVN